MATTRARSVVRISRRSSEPQVEGSKPSGPAILILVFWCGFTTALLFCPSIAALCVLFLNCAPCHLVSHFFWCVTLIAPIVRILVFLQSALVRLLKSALDLFRERIYLLLCPLGQFASSHMRTFARNNIKAVLKSRLEIFPI